ncbi:MAG: hypothetical protein E6Q33_00835 [Neisseriales bacterium]|nr:MAG: hypothetical protein E6Q33_00835 [Neisseriales bacterium]
MNIVRFYATEDQIDYLKTVSNKSQFIRDAIDEKLAKIKPELDNEIGILKNLKDFNPKQFQSILLDNELMNQTLYEEIKKQNEILKLILRRATMSSVFGYSILENLTNEVNSDKNQQNALNIIKDDFDNLKL